MRSSLLVFTTLVATAAPAAAATWIDATFPVPDGWTDCQCADDHAELGNGAGARLVIYAWSDAATPRDAAWSGIDALGGADASIDQDAAEVSLGGVDAHMFSATAGDVRFASIAAVHGQYTYDVVLVTPAGDWEQTAAAWSEIAFGMAFGSAAPAADAGNGYGDSSEPTRFQFPLTNAVTDCTATIYIGETAYQIPPKRPTMIELPAGTYHFTWQERDGTWMEEDAELPVPSWGGACVAPAKEEDDRGGTQGRGGSGNNGGDGARGGNGAPEGEAGVGEAGVGEEGVGGKVEGVGEQVGGGEEPVVRATDETVRGPDDGVGVRCGGVDGLVPERSPSANLVKIADESLKPGQAKGGFQAYETCLATEDIPVYRLYGGPEGKKAGPDGAWWTPAAVTEPSTREEAWRDAAICPQFNEASMIRRCKVKKGVVVAVGLGESIQCDDAHAVATTDADRKKFGAAVEGKALAGNTLQFKLEKGDNFTDCEEPEPFPEPACETPGAIAAAPGKLRIGSWNLQNLGWGDTETELKKDYEAIAATIDKNFDVLAIEEVMDDKGLAGLEAIQVALTALGAGWAYVVTDDATGVSVSHREHYAILYRQGVVAPEACAQGASNDLMPRYDGKKSFVRPPAWACFRAKSGADFMLAAFHAIYDKGKESSIAAEVKALRSTFEAMQQQRPEEQDIFMVGDFNLEVLPLSAPAVDQTEATMKSTLGIRTKDDPSRNGELTDNSNLYDHLVVYGTPSFAMSRAKVLDVRCATCGQAPAGNSAFRDRVSDHLPIVALADVSGADGDPPLQRYEYSDDNLDVTIAQVTAVTSFSSAFWDYKSSVGSDHNVEVQTGHYYLVGDATITLKPKEGPITLQCRVLLRRNGDDGKPAWKDPMYNPGRTGGNRPLHIFPITSDAAYKNYGPCAFSLRGAVTSDIDTFANILYEDREQVVYVQGLRSGGAQATADVSIGGVNLSRTQHDPSKDALEYVLFQRKEKMTPCLRFPRLEYKVGDTWYQIKDDASGGGRIGVGSNQGKGINDAFDRPGCAP